MTRSSSFECFSFAAPCSPAYGPPPFYMANAEAEAQGAIGIYESPDGATWSRQSDIPDANIARSGFPAPWPVPAICLCKGLLYVACTSSGGEVTVWRQGPEWTRVFELAAGLTNYQPVLAAFGAGGPEVLWLIVATPAGTAQAWTFDGSSWSQPFPLLNPSGGLLSGKGSLSVAPLRASGSNPPLLLLAWGGEGGTSPVSIYLTADGAHWYAIVPNPPLLGTPAAAEAAMAPGGYVVSVIGVGDAEPFITSCWGNGAQTIVSWESGSGAPAILVPPGGAEVLAYGTVGWGDLVTQALWPVSRSKATGPWPIGRSGLEEE